MERKILVSLAGYVLLALSLSALIFPFNAVLTPDGAHYGRMGANFFLGRGLTSNYGEPYLLHAPFYGILAGAVNLLVRDLGLSLRLVSLASFSLTVIPVFLLARDLYGTKAAHWTSLLFATHGFLLVYSNLAASDPLFYLLIYTLLYGAHRLIQRETAGPVLPALFFGGIGGLAYLTRFEGVLHFTLLLTALFFFMRKPLRSRSLFAALALATFFLVCSPYVYYVFEKTGRWRSVSTLFETGVTARALDVAHLRQYDEVKKIFHGLAEDHRRLEMDRRIENFDLFETLRKNDGALLKSAARTLAARITGFLQYLYGGFGLILVMISWFSGPWGPRRRRSEVLMGLYLLPFLPFLITIYEVRRYLMILPLFLLWSGNGLEQLRISIRANFPSGKRLSILVPGLVLLVFACGSAWYLSRALTKVESLEGYRRLGAWMKENLPEVEREGVAAENPYLHFYSGANYLKLPYVKRFEDLRDYLEHHRTKYFVVGDDLDPPLTESFGFLLDEKRPPPAGIVRRFTVEGEKKLILYEVLRR